MPVKPLAILQPTLIPDLHDLAVMITADTIVFQDTELWSRKGRTHRALIRTPEGTDYISVPVMSADKKKQINDVRIDHGRDWIHPILQSLEFNYRNSVYYDFYEPEIRADIELGSSFEYLLDFSLFLKNRLFQFLEIEILADITFGSGVKHYSSDPDKLAKHFGTETYYQEHDARHYQRQGQKQTSLIFEHPEYRQHFDGFEPYCCLLDLLFQYGPESFRVIDELTVD